MTEKTSDSAKSPEVENIEDQFPLSPMQAGMLFHSRLATSGDVYLDQIVFRIEGKLEVHAFENAWQRVVEHHEILRTSFRWEGLDHPLQVVHRRVSLPFIQHDWRELSATDRESRLESLIQEDRAKGFDLSKAPLTRVTLIRLADDLYQFIWSGHHLLLDGWSQSLVLKQVLSSYQAISGGKEPELEPASSYRDYVDWLAAGDLREAGQFWKETLAGFADPTSLGIVRPPPGSESEGLVYAEAELRLSSAATTSLQDFARRRRLTPFTLLQGAWAILLSRYSGLDDVVFGATVSVRPPELENIETAAGLFINTIPVRARLGSNDDVLQWLHELQLESVEAREHQHAPLIDIQGWSDVPRGLPLFDSLLVFENYPEERACQPGNKIDVQRVNSIVSRTNYPLVLLVMPGAQLTLTLISDARRFDGKAIRRMLGHLQTILTGLVTEPARKHSSLPLLTPDEQQRILFDWNKTEQDYERLCVHELFENQVVRTPDAVAVQFENQQLTYAELNARANQLANYLRGLGVGPETLVGICVERSPEMMVGLLGILKAGGAYVPLDPAFPKDRIAFMIEDSKVPVLLTQQKLAAELPPNQAKIVRLDSDGEMIAQESAENLVGGATSQNPAYVIYTSGSTGRPKGVQIDHRALTNFLNSVRREPGLTPDDVLLSVTTLSFDIAALELYLPLIVGARLDIAGREIASDGHRLQDRIANIGATMIQATPATWRMLIDAGWAGKEDLKILCGGEALSRELANQLLERSSSLWNMYGPTETTIWSAMCKIESEDGPILIGRPIANTQIYILDKNLELVPIGVAGELHIGGDGLARGYLNRPELTAQKFIRDPFSNDPTARLYKTGDLARYLSDGRIECLGRIDDQVKIRGFRIELGEIESILRQHAAVRECVVVAREDSPGDRRLAAYVVTTAGMSFSALELRAFLQEKLPDYMVPSAIVEMAELPLTPNEKVDRRALPAPDYSGELKDRYVAPQSPVQELLAGIWAEVLKVSRVGIDDNFFELGGHSLLATQIVSRVLQMFKVELPLRALFEAPTIATLSDRIEALRGDTETLLAPVIAPALRNGTAPLSFGQQSFWFLDSLTPDSALYNIFRIVRMRGPLNVTALRNALDEMVARHESLRTTFLSEEGEPVQVIAERQTFSLSEFDLRQLPKQTRETDLRGLLEEEIRRPFALANYPLVRAALFRLESEEHVMIFSMHHIVADDWSMSIFARELKELYEGFVSGWQPQLPELPIQYGDFAYWQRNWLQNGLLDKQLKYWKQQLAGVPALLELPTDRPRPPAQTFRAEHYLLLLPRELRDRLVKLSQREGVSLFMTLLAAFQMLLARYSGKDDIVIGSPVAGRNRVETENMIGHFINTLVLRTSLAGNPTFSELLGRVRDVALGAYAHQETPFEKLVEELQPERSLSHTPLFQVMFVLQNAPDSDLDLSGLSISTEEFYHDVVALDLTLEARETDAGIRCVFEYKSDLFDASTIERMAGHFQLLLESVAEDPSKETSTLPLLTETETKQLLLEWNDTSQDYPKNLCIHQLFEAQVENTPNAVAVMFEGESLTYSELNERANRLGHYLRSLGVSAESLVAICMERSIEMMVAVLGILKAGGAYVPLDPAYPRERINLIAADTNAQLVLTQQKVAATLSEVAARIILVDTDWRRIEQQSAENPAPVNSSDSLAYVIYTSGSTGAPKGVMIEHRSLVNFTTNARDEYRIGPADRVLQFASLNFDASAEEIFPCLTSGATLVLRTDEMLSSVSEFLETCNDWGITVLDLPTAYWHEITAGLEGASLPMPSSLRLVIIGGERALPERFSVWQTRVGSDVRLVNTYGPTEATVVATKWDTAPFAEENGPRRELPIGRPLANVTTYVLDRNLQPVPIGVPGELHIGGDGLARGYFNQPELTAQKFIGHPFSGQHGARLYKTGDLVRYLIDGNIEYLGRVDDQVKIRGFRIELGEIESILRRHKTVRESVVIAREVAPGDSRLVAYVTPVERAKLDPGELRSFLRQRLPDYMIPSTFVELTELPLTPSGKLDRRALSATDYEGQLQEQYSAPRTPAQDLLAGIWAEVLKVPRIGINDNFFELGGHSLLATRVISRVREAFQIELPLRSIFEAPTISDLAKQIEVILQSEQAPPASPITSVPRSNHMPLSFAQERLWFIEQFDPDSSLYNICRVMRLRGPLNLKALQEALDAVVARHETLRTNFVSLEGGPAQVIAEHGRAQLVQIDLGDRNPSEREAEALRFVNADAQRPFELACEPLLRTTLLRLSEEENILAFTIHHIICDGWSIEILLQEFSACYEALTRGISALLPELPVQYVDYAYWQRQWLTDEVLQSQLSYWKQQLDEAPALLMLPTDRPRPAVQIFNGARDTLLLPASIAEQLKSLSRREGVTLFMTLLSAFISLLARYSGQDDIVVGTPTAGRNRIETEGLIGLFVNTLALHTNLSGDPKFKELLRRVREVTLGAYAHQDLPFEKVVEELKPERNLSHHPLFQVMFVLQSQALQAQELSGIRAEPVEIESRTAKFDLTLEMFERAEGILCSLEYNTDLFDPNTIARMLGHFQTLLESVIANPEQKTSALPLLSEAERHQLLVEWNDTKTDYPSNKCIQGLFEHQADNTPDATALIWEERQITYRELNSQANQLANYLRKRGVGPDTRVGVCVERSPEMIVALLGILKAGGAYVPLDPAYPRTRLEFMLEDAHAPLLLTQRALLPNLPVNTAEVLCVDELREELARESRHNPEIKTTADNLAYVMYTSGSTGKPKGVAVTHRNVVRLVKNTNYASFSSDEIFLQCATISFDASTFEIWGSLLNGARLTLLPAGTPSLRELGQAIKRYRVTTLWLTAGLFHLMVDNHLDDLRGVRQLLAGGDVLSVPHVQKVFQELKGCRLINGYGPTENTTFTCCYPIDDLAKVNGSVPIGRPVSNTSVYILDGCMNPTPIGVAGELYIGGDGLAAGYLDRPELNAERFVRDPFSTVTGARLYRTGDLVRYRATGEIEFIGRIDNQVKVRGFRVELGEIETALVEHPSVREAVVVARKDEGDKHLAAYLVPRESRELPIDDVREFLQQRLPDHMVPSVFVVLESLPLSPMGKVDRRALPATNGFKPKSENSFAAPGDELELKLTRIWERVLNVRPIGVDENFFELGGHSLLAVRLFAQIEKTFDKNLPLATLFQAPTVKQLARVLRNEGWRAAWSSLVMIQSGNERPPFFCVHAAGGNVLEYHDLARRLGPDQPFYGLQAKGLSGEEQPHTSITEMAAHYLKEMREVQPEGPYLIGGRSSGGTIAFEMACQLAAEGQKVAMLALLDTYPAGYFKLLPDSGSLRQRAGRYALKLKSHANNLRQLSAAEKVAYIFRKLQYAPAKTKHALYSRAYKIYERIGRPLPAVLKNIEQINFAAVKDYVPQMYSGDVTLFLATDLTADYDLHDGWQELVQGVIEAHEISGNHIDIIKEPHVRALAERLRACLERAQEDHPRIVDRAA